MSDYKLTIYADPSGPVGHFSVEVTGPDINVPVYGKYPKDEKKTLGAAQDRRRRRAQDPGPIPDGQRPARPGQDRRCICRTSRVQ